MKTSIEDWVWPVENYTDKIWVAVKYTIENNSWLSFTAPKIVERIRNGYPWLALDTERQQLTLAKIVAKCMGKMVQQGLAVRVQGPTTIERTWKSTKDLKESGYTNVSSEDAVAKTEAAKKACRRRSVGGQTLWRLNNMNFSNR